MANKDEILLTAKGFAELEEELNELRTTKREENIQAIKEETIRLYKLETLLENWDKCHNEKGDAIIPKDKELWNKVYMDGDFIDTIVEE